jgi:hypothetical protein
MTKNYLTRKLKLLNKTPRYNLYNSLILIIILMKNFIASGLNQYVYIY